MKKTFMTSVLLLLSVVAVAQDIERFVKHQLPTYPESRLLDIYKSCFQDYMGAEHLVSDSRKVKAYLDEELNTTTLDDLMPWHYEPCGIDSSFYRVSIRTVKEDIITEELLLDAFIRSANSDKRPTVDSWKDRWHKIIGTIEQMKPDLPYFQEDRRFIDSILSVGKYAISHSPEYREAYRPHYRIVEREIFEREIKPLIEQKVMVVRIAEIEVYPEYLKEYLTAARNVGAESVKNEPGVICIFPNQVKDDETKFRIVEIYRNQEAYQHHLTTPHFQTYKQGTLHMVKSLRLLDIKPLDADAMPFIFKKYEP
jgi:quinol monooxygenase YgiN